MHLTLLKSKLHRATVTGADLDYEGSVAIDSDLCALAGFKLYERVEIYNITTGARFATYVIMGDKGEVCLNGAAARLVQKGDHVIICSYAGFTEQEAALHEPTVVLLDEENQPKLQAKQSGGLGLKTLLDSEYSTKEGRAKRSSETKSASSFSK